MKTLSKIGMLIIALISIPSLLNSTTITVDNNLCLPINVSAEIFDVNCDFENAGSTTIPASTTGGSLVISGSGLTGYFSVSLDVSGTNCDDVAGADINVECLGSGGSDGNIQYISPGPCCATGGNVDYTITYVTTNHFEIN